MKHNRIMTACCGCTLLAVIIRLLQLLFCIDAETGFSKTDSFSSTLLVVGYIIIALCIIGVLIFTTYFNQNQPTEAPKVKNNKMLGVAALVIGVYDIYPLAAVTIGGLSGVATVKAILLLLNMLFFILYGISAFAEIKIPQLLSLAPVIYSLFILIEQFLSYNGVANISENIFCIIFMCLQTIFYLHHSKIICSTELRRSCRLVLPVGSQTFILSAICTIPQLVLYVTVGSDAMHNSGATSFGFLLTGLYALTFITALYNENK